jgi:hypothetical protein
MWFRAMGGSLRIFIKAITTIVTPGAATRGVHSESLASKHYRQCDPSASEHCCLRIVYPDERDTGIIKFPGYAVSRQTSRMESEHGAA